MSRIEFNCPNCDRFIKVAASQAGKRARCPNPSCRKPLTVPKANETAKGKANPTASVGSLVDEDDEGPTTYAIVDDDPGEISSEEERKRELAKLYGISDEEEEEEEENDGELTAEEIEKRRERRKRLIALRKAPVDREAWERVRLGMSLMVAGAILATLALMLTKIPLLIGLFSQIVQVPEYGYLASRVLIDPDSQSLADYGEHDTYYIRPFIFGLLSHSSMMTLTSILFILGSILMIFRLIANAAAYGFFITAPSRHGERGLAIAGVSVTTFNLFVVLFLQLLPVTGALTYFPIPFITPEIALVSANIERTQPIHLTWSWAPFWEVLMAIILHVSLLSEIAIYSVFVRSCGLSLKDEHIEGRPIGLTRLSLGIVFMQVTYLLLFNTGTTEVLINLLRVVFLLTVCFTFWQLSWVMRLSLMARKRIARIIKE